MKNNRTKKVLSFVLAASMVFTAVAPTLTYADKITEETLTKIEQQENEKKVYGAEYSACKSKINILKVNAKLNGKVKKDLKGTISFEVKKANETIVYQYQDVEFDKDGLAILNLNLLRTEASPIGATTDTTKAVDMGIFNTSLATDEAKAKMTIELVNEDTTIIERDVELKNVSNEGVTIKGLTEIDADIFDIVGSFDVNVTVNGLKDNSVLNTRTTVKVKDATEEAKAVAGTMEQEDGVLKINKTDEKNATVTIEFVESKAENAKVMGKIVYTTDEDGKIKTINGADVKLDKDGKIENIDLALENSITSEKRFEIKNYNTLEDAKIEKVRIVALERNPEKTEYLKDEKGNFKVASNKQLVGETTLTDNFFKISKFEIHEGLENNIDNTAINIGKADQQNIVAFEFTSNNRVDYIYMPAEDIMNDNINILKINNPFADYKLDVTVVGGNPTKAVAGATVEILPAELNTLGVVEYGKAIATSTTDANGLAKFEKVQLEKIIKLFNKDEKKVPFKVIVKDAKGFEEKGVILEDTNITEGTLKIDLNTAETAEAIRIAGKDRYETALKVAKEQYVDGSEKVVLASGKNYADALVGARYAKSIDAALLLVDNTLSQDVKTFLDQATKEVIILGGESSVSTAIANDAKYGKMTVTRIAGENRYATSVKVAEAMKDVENVFVASGEVYADALVASAAANRAGKSAVVLTEGAKVPAEVTKYMTDNKAEIKKAYVFGGENTVNKAVYDEVEKLTGLEVERISGVNREDTSVVANGEFFKNDVRAVVVSGNIYADALVAGTMDRPVVLLTDSITSEVKTYLNENIINIKVVGGTNSVSDALVDEAIKNLK